MKKNLSGLFFCDPPPSYSERCSRFSESPISSYTEKRERTLHTRRERERERKLKQSPRRCPSSPPSVGQQRPQARPEPLREKLERKRLSPPKRRRPRRAVDERVRVDAREDVADVRVRLLLAAARRRPGRGSGAAFALGRRQNELEARRALEAVQGIGIRAQGVEGGALPDAQGGAELLLVGAVFVDEGRAEVEFFFRFSVGRSMAPPLSLQNNGLFSRRFLFQRPVSFSPLFRSPQDHENVRDSPPLKKTHAVGSRAAVSVRSEKSSPKIILASSPGVPAPSAMLLVRPKSA